MTVLATICARAGSKGLPDKNTRLFCGNALIAYTITQARLCHAIDDIVISTDSPFISQIAQREGMIVPWLRPSALAQDDTPKIEAIKHALAMYETTPDAEDVDIVVDLDVGCPLRLPEDIEGVIDALRRDDDADACVTIYEAERNPYFNMVSFNNVGFVEPAIRSPLFSGLTRRQDAPEVFSTSPAVFAWKRAALAYAPHFYAGNWKAYMIPRERGIDIDTELDLRIAEALMMRRHSGLSR